MAFYNPYSQQSYNPYPQSYGPSFQQSQQSFAPQQSYAPQPQMNSGINWVQGEIGAKAYPVAPGNSVLLMDSDGQYFYIKSADMTGMPQLRRYSYQEVIDEPMKLEDKQSHQTGPQEYDTSKFAPREEMKELQEEIKTLKEQITKLESDNKNLHEQVKKGEKNGQ